MHWIGTVGGQPATILGARLRRARWHSPALRDQTIHQIVHGSLVRVRIELSNRPTVPRRCRLALLI
jgi:hypothetical protein